MPRGQRKKKEKPAPEATPVATPAPATPAAASPDVDSRLARGTGVRLEGLKGAAHLNGMTGVCQAWDSTSSRWIVTLDNGGEQKSLKAENLVVDLTRPAEAPRKESEEHDEAEDEDGGGEEEGAGLRMASDKESGFAACMSLAAARQAYGDGETKLEFAELPSAAERSDCLDFVCNELLANGDGARKLRGLSFAACSLRSAEIKRLAEALALDGGAGSLLVAFGVSKNPGVEPDAWQALFCALPAKAMWLDFGDNELKDAGVFALMERLPGREDLDKLYLDGNKLRDVTHLCKALPDTGITNLDLGDNAFGDTEVELLAVILHETVMTNLVLGTNPIGNDGVSSLFERLNRLSLDTLYLDNTGADDSCLEILGPLLKDSGLTELHLDNTKITDAGVRTLIPYIAASELNFLDISENGVSDETSRGLGDALSARQDAIVETQEEIQEVQDDDADAEFKGKGFGEDGPPSQTAPAGGKGGQTVDEGSDKVKDSSKGQTKGKCKGSGYNSR